MKRFPCLFVFSVFLILFGFLGAAFAEDVVYLKDGSIIHGTITEEVPGKTIKIETKDGNVFVYKMKAIDKITHSKPDSETSTGTDNANSQASPALTPVFSPTVKIDPNARFSKFAFTLNAGFWAPGTFTDINPFIENVFGDSTYDYLPGWVKAGVGVGWLTNGFGLKWNVQLSYQPDDVSYSGTAYDPYYNTFYTYTGTISTSLLIGGTEFEADIDMDNVTNANNVTSLYIPLMAGFWEEQFNYDDGTNSATFSNTTTSFGTGIGFRGFDSSNFLWDIQLVYRGCTRGNDLTDPNGYKLPLPDGKYLDANVSGLDLNFTVGFLTP